MMRMSTMIIVKDEARDVGAAHGQDTEADDHQHDAGEGPPTGAASGLSLLGLHYLGPLLGATFVLLAR